MVPTTWLSDVISTVGSSTIFCADTVMPLRNSYTVAGLPSTVNL